MTGPYSKALRISFVMLKNMFIYVQDLFVRVIILSKQFAKGDAEFNQLQSCSGKPFLQAL